MGQALALRAVTCREGMFDAAKKTVKAKEAPGDNQKYQWVRP